MKITLTNIGLQTIPGINQVIHLAWKIEGQPDSDYDLHPLPDATVNPSGDIISPDPYEFLTGTGPEDIRVRAINSCNAAYQATALFNGIAEPFWIGGAYVCEQDDPITLADTYAGFSSPQTLYWDNTSGRFYVIDLDAVTGNLYWINPATFTGFGDQNIVPGSSVPGQFVQSHDFDPVQRKIFMVGPGTGGVYVYNIATETMSTIPDGGTDGAFARLLCRLINGKLYVSNKFDSTLTIINPVTQVVESTVNVNTIPGNGSNQYFNNAYQMYGVNGEVWVCAGGYRGVNGNIARYNADLTSFLGQLNIPGVTPPSGVDWQGGFWQSQFHDTIKQKFYVSDTGSKLVTVFNALTMAMETQIPITNNQGKLWGVVGWSLNTLSGQLYANQNSVNIPSDAGILKFFIQDRDTYEFQSMFTNQTVTGLSLREGTNQFWAAASGAPGWAAGPPPGWDTDGLIFKYTS